MIRSNKVGTPMTLPRGFTFSVIHRSSRDYGSLRRKNPVTGFTLTESECVHFSLFVHSIVAKMVFAGFGEIRTVVAATRFFSSKCRLSSSKWKSSRSLNPSNLDEIHVRNQRRLVDVDWFCEERGRFQCFNERGEAVSISIHAQWGLHSISNFCHRMSEWKMVV